MSKRKLKSKHMGILTPFVKDIKSVKHICRKFINESENMWISEDKKRICFYIEPKNRLTICNNGSLHLHYITKKWFKYGPKHRSVPVGHFSICARLTKKEIYDILKGSRRTLELALKTNILEGLK